MVRKLAYALFVSLIALSAPSLSTLSQADEPTGQIAFVMSGRDVNNLCTVELGQVDLICTGQAASGFAPALVWSPDGNHILYQQSSQPSELGSQILDVVTGTITSVPFSIDARAVEWSPDGLQLLVVGTRSTEEVRNIYTMAIDGSDLRRLTHDEQDDTFPSWSPDGTMIVYLSGFPDVSLILISPDGKTPRALTPDLVVNWEVPPVWSPDSSTIAFAVRTSSANTAQTSDIYTIKADGTDLRRLTNTGEVNLNPRWSPDGTQLVFYGYALDAFESTTTMTSLRTEVFRVNADGSDLVNLTNSSGLDYHPDWSPDGEWIAFASTRDTRPGIFIMRPDGSDVRMVTRQLTFAEGGREAAHNPVWRPLPR